MKVLELQLIRMNLTLISVHMDGSDAFVESWVLVYKMKNQQEITVGKLTVWKMGKWESYSNF
jgi:hypothetical protein